MIYVITKSSRCKKRQIDLDNIFLLIQSTPPPYAAPPPSLPPSPLQHSLPPTFTPLLGSPLFATTSTASPPPLLLIHTPYSLLTPHFPITPSFIPPYSILPPHFPTTPSLLTTTAHLPTRTARQLDHSPGNKSNMSVRTSKQRI